MARRFRYDGVRSRICHDRADDRIPAHGVREAGQFVSSARFQRNNLGGDAAPPNSSFLFHRPSLRHVCAGRIGRSNRILRRSKNQIVVPSNHLTGHTKTAGIKAAAVARHILRPIRPHPCAANRDRAQATEATCKAGVRPQFCPPHWR